MKIEEIYISSIKIKTCQKLNGGINKYEKNSF